MGIVDSKMKLYLMVLVLCLMGVTSAESIELGNYVIDTGAYGLPIDSQYTPGLRQYTNMDSNPTFTWRWNADNPWAGGISIFNESIDPTKIPKNITTEVAELNIDYGLLSGVTSACGDNSTQNKFRVSVPYPGLITTTRCPNLSNGKPMTAYAGHIEGPFYLLVMSREDPDMAVYILKNLKVIQKSEESVYESRQLASALA